MKQRKSMPFVFWTKRKIILSGQVATINIHIEDDLYPGNDRLYIMAIEFRRQIEQTVENYIEKYLGGDFELIGIAIKKGSAEIEVIIGTTLTLLYGLSRYKNLVESLALMKDHLKIFLRQLFGNSQNISVEGNFVMTPAINQSPETMIGCCSNKILLYYILFSHTVLLGIAVILILHRYLE